MTKGRPLSLVFEEPEALPFVNRKPARRADAPEPVVYLAAAPKSTAIYVARNEATKDALETRAATAIRKRGGK